MIDTKMQEIAKHRGFTNFWEAFDYMILANYTEIEALMIGLEMFNGKIWDDVINASWKDNQQLTWIASSGTTMLTGRIDSEGNYIMGYDPANESDDLNIKIFIMTSHSNPVYLPIYKSYVETRKYAEIEMIEKHIKEIRIKLTSELLINLFKEGCKNKIK